MGYDLRPRNKKIDEFSIGAFSWPIILQETGMGYVLGYGKSMCPGQYVYQSGNNGSPASNDGYKVTSDQAKCMAKIARGFLSVQLFVNEEWDKLNEEERIAHEETKFDGKCIYRPAWRNKQVLDKIEQFAEFAEKSQGFTIH